MSKASPAKPRSKKIEAPAPKRAASAGHRGAERAERAERPDHDEPDHDDERSERASDDERVVMCRSCGKRPGRPTAILGQMTQAELCPQCTALRKERIRLNRAAARGMRSSRLY
jgi:hypothetical protein